MRSEWLLSVFLLGCTGIADDEATTETGATTQAIVDGTVSTDAQDSAVEINVEHEPVDNHYGLCTGTLIAPNLVLTAHHCVATIGSGTCATLGELHAASRFMIYGGVDSRTTRNLIAKVSKVYVPTNDSICSYDMAILQLDRAVTSAKIAKLRFAAPAKDESVVAVGYGIDGDGNANAKRMQRTTKVLAVGPIALAYETKSGTSLPAYALPSGDIATGESHCNGDSGGPLYDAESNLIGVISRGYPTAQLDKTDTSHGSSQCIDLPEMYSSVAFNEDFIRTTAKALGQTLAAETSTSKTASVISGPDADDDQSSPRKRNEVRNKPDVANAGCSTTPQSPSGTAWWLVAVVGLLFSSRRYGSCASESGRRARHGLRSPSTRTCRSSR